MALETTDPAVYELVRKEILRQQKTIGLIASENFVSKAVLEASGSVFTNKYAEGYPGKRYYAGNQVVDPMESLAIERAKQLFGVDHANVQPHAGAPANMAVFYAFLNLGDKFMGLELPQGGHLTHGSPVNFSGKWYKAVAYAVDKSTEMLDYTEIRKRAHEEKPKLMIAGYTAYPRIIDFKQFREIADEIGATLLVDMSHFAGLVAGGVYPSPAPYADVITTTTHKTLRGPRGAMIMCKKEHAEKIDKAVFPGLQGGPIENHIAAKAVCYHEAMQPDFKTYAAQIVKNAKTLSEELSTLGLRLISGGTDTHLILADLTPKGVTGKDAQIALEEAGIVCNRNTIPYDTKSPFVTSGIRLGTPGLTTRGMKESEMKEVARLIMKVLADPTNAELKLNTKMEVEALCDKFPIYQDL